MFNAVHVTQIVCTLLLIKLIIKKIIFIVFYVLSINTISDYNIQVYGQWFYHKNWYYDVNYLTFCFY